MWGDTIQADIFTQWLQKIASITLAFAELLTVASGMGDAWLRSALLVSTCGKTSPWQERLMLATHQKCSAEVASVRPLPAEGHWESTGCCSEVRDCESYCACCAASHSDGCC